MMPSEVVQLPKSRNALAAILFPAASSQRIPVTTNYFSDQQNALPDTAADYLYEADSSTLPVVMTSLLLGGVRPASTEMVTSHLIARFFSEVFYNRWRYSRLKVGFGLYHNSSETRLSSQLMLKPQARPDTLVILL